MSVVLDCQVISRDTDYSIPLLPLSPLLSIPVWLFLYLSKYQSLLSLNRAPSTSGVVDSN